MRSLRLHSPSVCISMFGDHTHHFKESTLHFIDPFKTLSYRHGHRSTHLGNAFIGFSSQVTKDCVKLTIIIKQESFFVASSQQLLLCSFLLGLHPIQQGTCAYMCESTCIHACEYPQRLEEGFRSPDTGVTGGCGCWELNQDPMREYLALLTTHHLAKLSPTTTVKVL